MIDWGLFSRFAQTVTETAADIETAADAFISVARIIGYIFACIYVVRRYAQRQAEETGFSFMDLLYPIFISLVLTYYKPLAHGIETALTGISQDVSQQSIEKQAPLAKSFFDYFDKTDNAIEQAKEKGADQWSANMSEAEKRAIAHKKKVMGEDIGTGQSTDASILDDLEAAFTYLNPMNILKDKLYELEKLIFELAGKCAIMGLWLVSKAYLVIFFVLGPLAIGFSLVPGFEFAIVNWFQRYISYCLWLPVFNVFLRIGVAIISAYQDFDTTTVSISPIPSLAPMAVAGFVLLAGFFTTAKISSTIIAAAPTGSALRSAGRAAAAGAKAAVALFV